MSMRVLLSVSAVGLFLGVAAPAAAQCHPDGDVEFICGPVSPEDLVLVPDSPWVIAAGMEDDGYLYAIDRRDHSVVSLFPAASYGAKPDPTYAGCSRMVTGGFRPHGLSLRAGTNGRHTLYVVRHGAREAIEVFELHARPGVPALTWQGCAEAPEGVEFNSVTALPGQGFAATHFNPAEGELWEWQPGAGWIEVPGSTWQGPNGLVSSPDGEWLYIGGWATSSLVRLSRGRTPVEVDSVDVGFRVDNVRWVPDGSLLAAGHHWDDDAVLGRCFQQGDCSGVTSRVARVDPETLIAEEIVRYPSNDHFLLGTVGLQVGDEIWVGSIAGSDRIARFPAR
ncbi:MAG TPA: hypothetical protein DGF10_03010 [Acidimicrobiaceae bacterium]|nr:hypothetical protein [Acidimicrobiaceae bacterium]